MKIRGRCFLFVMAFTTIANASSFVGNGGNAGDLELAVALRQTQKTFAKLAEIAPDDRVCTCSSELFRHGVCEPLSDLNADERAYCARFIRMKSQELSNLLLEKNRLRFEWTHQPITVQEGKRARAADAVSNAHGNVMTINQKRFLELKPIDRVFLLAHESLHFISLGDAPLADHGPQGPFKGDEGGRRFINSVAAAVSVAAQENKILSRESAPLKRSQANRDWWISLNFMNIRLSTSDSNFAHRSMGGFSLMGRYDFGGWGLLIENLGLTNKKRIYTQIDVQESRHAFALGAFYKYHPFNDPLTYWGQSHAIFSAKVSQVSGEYKMDDGYVETLDEATGAGWGFDCQFYIPFRWGLWGFASVGYLDSGLKFDQPRVDQKTSLHSGIGVAYGF